MKSDELCYDFSGQVLASKGVVPLEPWIVRKSEKYEGRYFFFNKETHSSVWMLNKKDIVLSESSSSSDSNNSNEKVVDLPSLCFAPRDKANNTDDISGGSGSSDSSIEVPKKLNSKRLSFMNGLLLKTGLIKKHGSLRLDPNPNSRPNHVFIDVKSKSLNLDRDPQSRGAEEQQHEVENKNTSYFDKFPTALDSSPSSHMSLDTGVKGQKENKQKFFDGGGLSRGFNHHTSSTSSTLSLSTTASGITTQSSVVDPLSMSLDMGTLNLETNTSSFPTLLQTPSVISSKRAPISFVRPDNPIDLPETPIQQFAPKFTSSYEFMDGLGLGGFSTVVKVKEIHSRERFAMKVIAKRKLGKPLLQDRIKLELDIMTHNQQTSAPFLQQCFDSFEDKFNVFFVSELIRGGDLFFHLSERTTTTGKTQGFSEEEARILLAEIYLGLEFLHKRNYIHGDIKIENIMVDNSGHVKIVDFGLAARLESEVQPMSPVGSLIYMAPELLFQKTGGRHTDWWAYGILAHELLTGHTPWSSINNARVVKKEIRTVQVAPPRILRSHAGFFITALLRHDIDERLGSRCDSDIREAKFFKSINWDKMLRLECDPAFVPGRINVAECDRQESIRIYNDLTNQYGNEQKALDDVYNGKEVVSFNLGLDDAMERLV